VNRTGYEGITPSLAAASLIVTRSLPVSDPMSQGMVAPPEQRRRRPLDVVRE
jgi:hypothetical protein